MGDLILYLGMTVVGYVAGSKLRDSREKLGWRSKISTAALMCLVMLMGMRMGSNEEITNNLSTIGVTAFVITVAVLVCSIGAVFIVRKFMGIDRYGRFADEREAEAGNAAPHEGEEEKSGINMMTILIVAAVAVGMLAGYFIIRNVFAGNMDMFSTIASNGIKVGLCILLIFVGMDLGLEGTVINNFRKVGLRIFIFPIAVALGTLAASGITGVLMGLTLREALAVGAGFGWYSLAPGIIMDAGHLTASAVSFLHNVMRELLAILFMPLVAAKIGFIETTSMPGSAAMDVCLPIVEKATRSDIAVYSFVSGVILSALVPVLVPIIIG